MSFWGFRPYVTVADRRAKALKETERLRTGGRVVSPVAIEGRKIASNFWGKAWCDNLERYSDFANRLPRGRSYVANGLVIDLRVARGRVDALVSGSDLYEVRIDIEVAAPSRWQAICADCSSSIGSIVELLQGKLSGRVMERVCRDADGLFPAPREIRMTCSCPDWAGMCKHVAATLYSVGVRLDHEPDTLFALRGVDRNELISVNPGLPIVAAGASERVLVDDDMAALFGLEFEAPVAQPDASTKPVPHAGRPRPARLAPTVWRPEPTGPATRKAGKAGTGAEGAEPAIETAGKSRAPRARAPAPKGKDAHPKESAASGSTKPRRSAATEAPVVHFAGTRPSSTFRAGAKAEVTARVQGKPGPRAQAREKSISGRTRAAKWIGARARKEPATNRGNIDL